MFGKLGLALLVASVLFIGFLFLRAAYPATFGGAVVTEEPFKYSAIAQAEMPGPAPPMEQQPRVEPPLRTTPGGPNPPNGIPAPVKQVTFEAPPEVQAHDPYDDPNSSSNLQDSLRQPQRLFSPGVVPENTQLPIMSGVASESAQTTAQALQLFQPELAMNGGEFMKGIAANDSTLDLNYGAF